ncbi:MAG: PKD domain protein [Prevotella sp.]|nr:PKD domain protein [Prevotella sp.]MBO5157762.1 PKD domain protein [Prevotella sp.]
MKKSRIFSALMLMALMAPGMVSCVSDDSEEGGTAIPELSVKGSDSDDMLTYNTYLGTECNITPEITYKGGDEGNLKYSWKIGTMANGVQGELEEVSTERNLNYKFTSGGTYYAHLTVSDGLVGQAVDYRINVNRTFEEGYILSSTDADGSGNLAFVKLLTPEEIAAGQKPVVIEHSLEAMNEGYSEKGLIRAVKASTTWPKTITRLLVSTDTRCFILDPNNFTILSDIKYGDLFPGFKATFFMPDSYTPWAYDSSMKKFVHVNITYMFPFEYTPYKECTADEFIIFNGLSWGREAVTTFFVNKEDNTVATYDGYASYSGYTTCFPNTADLLNGHDFIGAFMGTVADPSTYITPSYLLSRDNATGDVCLWTNTENSHLVKPDNSAVFTRQNFTPTATTAVPQRGLNIVVSSKFQRYYYAVDNCVYVLLPNNDFALPDKSQYAIQLGNNEEVTFIDTNLIADELYVATVDKSTQRGNFYIYDCKDVRTDNATAVRPKAEYKNCAGRISNVMYKPSIQ